MCDHGMFSASIRRTRFFNFGGTGGTATEEEEEEDDEEEDPNNKLSIQGIQQESDIFVPTQEIEMKWIRFGHVMG